ncbi:MAG: NADH-quinone oxidoreductase subunit N [Betaproteobacteria bacterium RIFCSPLOWO2_12_FULL_65_110]|nr:MAG: NADH-quinone oxidoreductase subunit N [Betaproteobacteria bacterium RIFCSPLOWO2_12_FULL_65_110]
MSVPMPDLLPAYAEIFLVAMASVILIADLVMPGRDRGITYGLSLLTLLGCAVLTVGVVQGTGGGVTYTFSNMFVSDYMGNLLKMLTYIAVAACLVYSRGYMSDRDLLSGEFFVLTLFAMLGMMVMISANHFLTLYLGLELLSLCLYALVALNRDSASSTEAAMKYFVLGALASGLLLYGMSMIYGATGTLDISAVAKALEGGRPVKTVMVFGLVFVVAGLGFKLGVVPFHMWIPDVYHGAPTAVTLFIGSAPKLAAFAMAIRLLVNGLLPLAVDWQQMLVIMSVLSMAIGNLAALAQTNIKRMLAYSTISHMGFMLLGLLSGVVNNNWLNAADAYSASMFYAVVYVLMSLGAFGMVILLSRAGFEAENLSSFKGLNQRSPWFAFIMLLLMFSLAGIPPTAGFYAKLSVLQATIAAGQVWLAVVAVMFSLIGAFYYLRVVKLMYFDEAQDTSPVNAHLDMGVLLSANGLAVLLLGILPGPLMQLCFYSIKAL